MPFGGLDELKVCSSELWVARGVESSGCGEVRAWQQSSGRGVKVLRVKGRGSGGGSSAQGAWHRVAKSDYLGISDSWGLSGDSHMDVPQRLSTLSGLCADPLTEARSSRRYMLQLHGGTCAQLLWWGCREGVSDFSTNPMSPLTRVEPPQAERNNNHR